MIRIFWVLFVLNFATSAQAEDAERCRTSDDLDEEAVIAQQGVCLEGALAMASPDWLDQFEAYLLALRIDETPDAAADLLLSRTPDPTQVVEFLLSGDERAVPFVASLFPGLGQINLDMGQRSSRFSEGMNRFWEPGVLIHRTEILNAPGFYDALASANAPNVQARGALSVQLPLVEATILDMRVAVQNSSYISAEEAAQILGTNGPENVLLARLEMRDRLRGLISETLESPPTEETKALLQAYVALANMTPWGNPFAPGLFRPSVDQFDPLGRLADHIGIAEALPYQLNLYRDPMLGFYSAQDYNAFVMALLASGDLELIDNVAAGEALMDIAILRVAGLIPDKQDPSHWLPLMISASAKGVSPRGWEPGEFTQDVADGFMGGILARFQTSYGLSISIRGPRVPETVGPLIDVQEIKDRLRNPDETIERGLQLDELDILVWLLHQGDTLAATALHIIDQASPIPAAYRGVDGSYADAFVTVAGGARYASPQPYVYLNPADPRYSPEVYLAEMDAALRALDNESYFGGQDTDLMRIYFHHSAYLCPSETAMDTCLEAPYAAVEYLLAQQPSNEDDYWRFYKAAFDIASRSIFAGDTPNLDLATRLLDAYPKAGTLREPAENGVFTLSTAPLELPLTEQEGTYPEDLEGFYAVCGDLRGLPRPYTHAAIGGLEVDRQACQAFEVDLDMAPSILFLHGLAYTRGDGHPYLEAAARGGVVEAAYFVSQAINWMRDTGDTSAQLALAEDWMTLAIAYGDEDAELNQAIAQAGESKRQSVKIAAVAKVMEMAQTARPDVAKRAEVALIALAYYDFDGTYGPSGAMIELHASPPVRPYRPTADLDADLQFMLREAPTAGMELVGILFDQETLTAEAALPYLLVGIDAYAEAGIATGFFDFPIHSLYRTLDRASEAEKQIFEALRAPLEALQANGLENTERFLEALEE